jgi:hypothetical protein
VDILSIDVGEERSVVVLLLLMDCGYGYEYWKAAVGTMLVWLYWCIVYVILYECSYDY